MSSRRGGDSSSHSARAYEFYLRANEVLRDWAQAHVARDLYRQCLAEDPAFAPGWAKLGRSFRLIAKYHLEDPPENLARGEEAFERALELDPDLPVAMSLMHDVLAVHEDPEALFLYGTCQAHAGDEGALASLTQALGTGYRVPAALRSNAWLSGLRRDGRLDALVERAEACRGEASRAFRANGGEELLGEL